MTLRTNYDDGGAGPAINRVTADDMNSISRAVNRASDALTVNGVASKLVSIGDNGFGTNPLGWNGTSTTGTGEMMFTVGVAATAITALWTHWYSLSGGGTVTDTDPAGAITFSASLKVVSSTNPGTVTGTIYRLTFSGRTSATIDPGGRIIADPLGLSLAVGDVVAIRTYLSSGTAYPPRGTFGAGWGGFTTTTDLTAPGSAAISSSTGYYYGPAALLGRAQGANNAKSVLISGDSIALGSGDAANYTVPAAGNPGGHLIRALTGKAGVISLAVAGDLAAAFQGTNGSFRRLSNAPLCNSAIDEYGSNDLVVGTTAAALEAIKLNNATCLARQGIAKVFITTLVPRTTSTDRWATTTNQTPLASESQRVAYNTWARANCPINPTTKAPVAVGTSGALLAGQFGHPITGFFDTAAAVESSLNSGLWLPAARVATGSITSGAAALTTSTANFLTANQESGGDKGTAIMLAGAGAAGATLVGNLSAVGSSTAATLDVAAGTTVTNAVLVVGVMTTDGVHPSPHGHYLMSLAIDTSVLSDPVGV